MTNQELLEFHRRLIAIPSISGQEGTICDCVASWLIERGIQVERQGNNLFALASERRSSKPLVCFNSHLDTVPASPQWTRDPFQPAVEDGRVYGLGSNDAKAPVAAMTAAFLRLRELGDRCPVDLLLTLAAQEEVGGKGTEKLIPFLREQGLTPDFGIIGEPTELNIAVAQKGLLILEVIGKGQACHAAHRKALGAPNAIRNLAQGLIRIDEAVESGELGSAHALLGEVTAEPTVIQGGTARNINPASASCYLDIRVNPGPSSQEGLKTVATKLAPSCELKIFSDRLKPYEIEASHPLAVAALKAAQELKPDARCFGSRGLSDLVFFQGIPAVKAGPGVSERSHTADEFVLESEILAGARFYENTVIQLGATLS